MADDAGDKSRRAGPRVVVMGVAGSGKTTVGEGLARALAVDFADADSFHTAASIDKMAGGAALDDEDRWPWLEAVGGWLDDHRQSGGVVACSALRRRYRDVLRVHAPDLRLLYLSGGPELISQRMAARRHHFMLSTQATSQFATLEPPAPDENAIVEAVSQPPEQIVSAVVTRLGRCG